MVGKGDLVDRIRASLAAYDDDALAALASPGLLRRAQKDLETVVLELAEEVDGVLRVKVGDATVSIREVPSQSTCDCPAGEICRHVLAALVYLRDAAAPAPVQSCEEEIVSVDEEALRKWAGTALLRRAAQKLAQGLEVSFGGSRPMLFEIPGLNANCRWMPGGGLGGMICSCHASTVCEHRVLAVLAYKVAKGGIVLEEEAKPLDVSPGAPRTREEIRASVRTVIHEMVAQGLTRVSSSTEQRLRTLAVSAHGVDLPRLERLLRALADEVALQLSRDARADVRSIVGVAATTEALCHALERPNPAIVGVHRSQYMPVGSIEISGMGARRWRTRSGYAGLTVYFWDGSLRNWATWTDSRPVQVGQFDGLARFGQPGPWEGCTAPFEASRHMLRLASAFRNPAGRLSGRPATKATVLRPSITGQVPVIELWRELTDRAFRLFGGSLGERDERDEIVLLRPSRTGRARFDDIRQEMHWPVLDSDGCELMLVLPHNAETAGGMRIIERWGRSPLEAILGLLRLSAGRLVVEPVTLHGPKGQVNLTLNEVHSPSARGGPASEEEDMPDEPTGDGLLPEASTTPLGLLLSSAEMELERIAESGVSVVKDLAGLREVSGRLEALGVICCASPLSRLVDTLGRSAQEEASHPSPAEAVLRAYYVCRLASTQEALMSMI